jgi:hypothetical protein
MAVGGSGATFSYDGTQWSANSTLTTNAQLLSVSCPNSSFCMAVDGIGQAFNYNGAWNTTGVPLDPPNTPTLNSVSCPSNTFCMVVDESGGYAYNFNGQAWSSGVQVGNSTWLNAVSCPNSSFCMAVALFPTGNAYSYRN